MMKKLITTTLKGGLCWLVPTLLFAQKEEISHSLREPLVKPTPTPQPTTYFARPELRGVWVSTVQRVDFPAKASTDFEVLKKEWLDLLNFYKSLNINAVIVQVRPTGDAIYPSKLVPYSKWLTGKSGKPLDKNADLLAFMVASAHAENMEFHAWINPYRLIIDGDTTHLDPKHLFKSHRSWCFQYGKEYMLNPGLPSVWRHLTAVATELVEKYPIDALHFDDYFYPYPLKGQPLPDAETFNRYHRGIKNIADWRRANVDSLIYNVHTAVKKRRPTVQVGVSPFAIWRNSSTDPRGSNTKGGVTCYDDLYADVLKWLEKGWLDYVAPEIYFHRDHPVAAYDELLAWWSKQNFKANLYISHAVYKVDHPAHTAFTAWKDVEELPAQIALARQNTRVNGLIFFSSKWLQRNPLGVTDVLQERFLSRPARLPQANFSGK